MRHLQIYRYIADVARRGSIRKSAEHLHITPSALTRKIQDFEEELGRPVFERLPQGMRLNDVGELVPRHIKHQNADFELVLSQISDLEGVRRGHVSLACAQAFVDNVLPEEIAAFRAQYPGVSFSVEARDNLLGLNALINYEADLALLIDPPSSIQMHELLVKKQPLCAVVRSDHALSSISSVRLRECCVYPVALPANPLAIRSLLNTAINRNQLPLDIAVESDSLDFLRNYVTREHAVTFLPLSSVPRGDDRIRAYPISPLDIEPIRVVLGQLAGRTLSSAASNFSEQLKTHLYDLS